MVWLARWRICEGKRFDRMMDNRTIFSTANEDSKGWKLFVCLVCFVIKKTSNVWRLAGSGELPTDGKTSHGSGSVLRNVPRVGKGYFFHGWQGRPTDLGRFKVARASRLHERQARRLLYVFKKQPPMSRATSESGLGRFLTQRRGGRGASQRFLKLFHLCEPLHPQHLCVESFG